MSTLLGWIEQASNEHFAYQGARGNFFVYDDCCVWSHPDEASSKQRSVTARADKLREFGFEQAELTADEVLASHEDNWRLERSEIAHAWYEEYFAPGPQSTPGHWAARLTVRLADGNKRAVVFVRPFEEDHSGRNRIEGWLGDRFSRGPEPPPKGWRGVLVKVSRL
jgi:hypothetical protein